MEPPINPFSGTIQSPLSPAASHPKKRFPFMGIIVFFLLGLSGFLAFQNWQLQKQLMTPTTYEECVASKGSTIQESYPATCVSISGARFTQPMSDEEKKKLLPPAQACTLEAKICPDGSAVGRTGPNCEFSPCPATP